MQVYIHFLYIFYTFFIYSALCQLHFKSIYWLFYTLFVKIINVQYKKNQIQKDDIFQLSNNLIRI